MQKDEQPVKHEKEHVKTMRQCQDPDVVVRSPNTEAAVAASAVVRTKNKCFEYNIYIYLLH